MDLPDFNPEEHVDSRVLTCKYPGKADLRATELIPNARIFLPQRAPIYLPLEQKMGLQQWKFS